MSDQSAFSDVWNGRRSLTETFLLWYLLVGVVGIGVVGRGLIVAIVKSSRDYVLDYAFVFMVFIPYFIWIYVGIWRSASINESAWGVVAKIYIVITVIHAIVKILA